MPTVVINRFDGGHAEDSRTFAVNQSESSVNFDIATNPHKLIPYSDPVAETSADGPMTDDSITDIAVLNVSSTPTIYGMGRASSGSQDVAIFKKNSTSDVTAQWTQVATNANDLTPGTLIEYKDYLWFLAGGSTWMKFTAPSTLAGISTLSGPYTTNFAPKPFRHPIDDTVYIGVANIVYKFDNVTYTTPTSVHTLATNFEIQSLTSYGNFLAIGGKYLTNSKRSAVYLSNRIIPNDGTQAVIDWGEETLAVLEEIEGTLIGISYTENVGSYTTRNKYKMIIKAFNGGRPVVIKEITTGTTSDIRVWKAKTSDKLYFGFDQDNAFFVLAKNKAGEWYVCKDRYYNPSGTSITGSFTGISTIGDISFVSYSDGGTDGYLARQGTSSAYTLPSRYTTTINPKMDSADRSKKKKLKEIILSYTVSASNGSVAVYIYRDGGASKLALSRTQSATGEYVTKSYCFDDATQFDESLEFQFLLQTTGNVSIKEFKYIYENVTE